MVANESLGLNASCHERQHPHMDRSHRLACHRELPRLAARLFALVILAGAVCSCSVQA